jgi:hypothetical protein
MTKHRCAMSMTKETRWSADLREFRNWHRQTGVAEHVLGDTEPTAMAAMAAAAMGITPISMRQITSSLIGRSRATQPECSSSVRAWSIWSYAYATMAAVAIVSPLRGERFVGLVAEDIAEVGDRGGDFGDRHCGEGTEGEPGDGGRRFVASEPVEKNGEAGQRGADFSIGRRRVPIIMEG